MAASATTAARPVISLATAPRARRPARRSATSASSPATSRPSAPTTRQLQMACVAATNPAIQRDFDSRSLVARRMGSRLNHIPRFLVVDLRPRVNRKHEKVHVGRRRNDHCHLDTRAPGFSPSLRFAFCSCFLCGHPRPRGTQCDATPPLPR